MIGIGFRRRHVGHDVSTINVGDAATGNVSWRASLRLPITFDQQLELPATCALPLKRTTHLCLVLSEPLWRQLMCVLLVEDKAIILMDVADVLESAGHEVLALHNDKHALDAIEELKSRFSRW